MSAFAPKFYPCLSYRDPAAAIRFLCDAFGFTEMLVVPDDDGGITHAELAFGQEVIMLGSAKPLLGWVSPLDLQARNTTIAMYVADVDAHFARAVAAGATVTRAPYDTPYGTRECSVRDPEQHEWHLGTYRPEPAATTA